MIGAINWGLVGGFDFNLVNAVFGSVAWLETLIYILVGLSALLMLMPTFGMGCHGGKCESKSGKGKGKCCK